jgi:glycosyltransferase involved in cell wall biosynthesis
VESTIDARAGRHHPRHEAGLFSILTTVYDTPPEYLRALAASLRAQAWTDYQWVLLDNGSRQRETRAALDEIAADPRVTALRADANLGILGGMRHVLERATGRYVLPVDSDDVLFPDTLSIMAAALQHASYPAVAYSDEDKLRDGRHVEAFAKPDWDPVLFRNCCYIAHLCAIDRAEALRLGVYTDPGAEGCHDWDTFLRFAREGVTPLHVPEILYSWRMHGGSTSAHVDAKDYVVDSQRHVLETHLARTGLADRLTVEKSPFFPASPDWWIRRRRTSPPPIALVAHGDGQIETDFPLVSTLRAGSDEPPLRAWQRAATAAPAVAVLDTRVTPTSDEWLWEMAGLKESFPDAAIVGGRLIDRRRMLVDNGRAADDPGYFGTALKQRTGATVPMQLVLLDSAWLTTIDPDACHALEGPALAAALAQHARAAGLRVVVSPFIEALV